MTAFAYEQWNGDMGMQEGDGEIEKHCAFHPPPCVASAKQDCGGRVGA